MNQYDQSIIELTPEEFHREKIEPILAEEDLEVARAKVLDLIDKVLEEKDKIANGISSIRDIFFKLFINEVFVGSQDSVETLSRLIKFLEGQITSGDMGVNEFNGFKIKESILQNSEKLEVLKKTAFELRKIIMLYDDQKVSEKRHAYTVRISMPIFLDSFENIEG